jgi:hypothetical protein
MDKTLRDLFIGLAVVMLVAFAIGLLIGQRKERARERTISMETSLKLAVNCGVPRPSAAWSSSG